MSPSPGESHIAGWLYWFLFPWHRLFMVLYFGTITIKGRENLPQQGPAVLAVKHFSRWDPFFVYLLSRIPMRFMTNVNQFGGIQGWFIKRLGSYPVDIARPKLLSLRHSIELLHQGHKLVIFPEGGIVRDQPLRSLKPGLARLVQQAESTAPVPLSIPIVPVGLRYDPDAQRGAKVWITIGKPLSTAQVAASDRKQAAEQLTTLLQAALLDCLASLPDEAAKE